MSTLKKVASQTSFQLIGKVISSITTLFTLSLITNHYGLEQTGLYTLILTYLAFFYLAVDLGLNAYALPLLDQEKNVFGKIVGFRLLLCLVLIIIALLGTFLMKDLSGVFFVGVFFGIWSIFGSAIYISCNLIFQKKFRYDLSVIAASVTSILTALLIYLMISQGFAIQVLLAATTICWLVSAFISLVFIKRYTPLKISVDFEFIGRTLVNVWPISSTLLLNVLYFRIDSFLLNQFRGLGEVGIYNFAYQFFQTALVLPTFIMNALYPLFLEKDNENTHTMKMFILKSFGLMVGIGTFGSIVTWVLSPFVINLVAFSGGFESSSDVLRILGLSFPAFFGSSVLMWSMVTFKMNKTMLLIYLVGFIFNFCLNYLLIPDGGYIVSSWVTVVSEYFILLLQGIVIIRYFLSK